MSETGRLEVMASTPSKSTPPKAAATAPAGTPADPVAPEATPAVQAATGDPAGEAAQARAEEINSQPSPPPASPSTDQEPADEEPEPQKTSTKALAAGDHLWYRGDYGSVFALVTGGGEGEANVLLLRPDEVVKGRTVVVYDSAEDAERGYGEGQPHVAWHV